jgi:hypothetical protein
MKRKGNSDIDAEEGYYCGCGKVYAHKYSLTRHQKQCWVSCDGVAEQRYWNNHLLYLHLVFLTRDMCDSEDGMDEKGAFTHDDAQAIANHHIDDFVNVMGDQCVNDDSQCIDGDQVVLEQTVNEPDGDGDHGEDLQRFEEMTEQLPQLLGHMEGKGKFYPFDSMEEGLIALYAYTGPVLTHRSILRLLSMLRVPGFNAANVPKRPGNMKKKFDLLPRFEVKQLEVSQTYVDRRKKQKQKQTKGTSRVSGETERMDSAVWENKIRHIKIEYNTLQSILSMFFCHPDSM